MRARRAAGTAMAEPRTVEAYLEVEAIEFTVCRQWSVRGNIPNYDFFSKNLSFSLTIWSALTK
jgi:hypothetical protein